MLWPRNSKASASAQSWCIDVTGCLTMVYIRDESRCCSRRPRVRRTGVHDAPNWCTCEARPQAATPPMTGLLQYETSTLPGHATRRRADDHFPGLGAQQVREHHVDHVHRDAARCDCVARGNLLVQHHITSAGQVETRVRRGVIHAHAVHDEVRETRTLAVAASGVADPAARHGDDA